MSAILTPALEPGALEKFREAGRIAREARELGISLIKPGVLLREVVEKVEGFIVSQGAGMAFPAQTSRNHIAAHYCCHPTDSTEFEKEDVVKIDIGVEVDGYVADNAQTKYLGENPHWKQLIQASADGLAAAIETVGPGVQVRQISTAIENAIKAQGFRPVYNLTGHGVARWRVHTSPQIPASPDSGDKFELRPGMVIAIEPFATDGRGQVTEHGRGEVFMMRKAPRKMKQIDEDVWAVIEGMNGLPFARRTFGSMAKDAVESTITRLIRTGCLSVYPPLVDPDPKVRIAQTEHTMIVTDNGCEVITRA
ncbi:MAG: type II methionyl aminopeptidase [Planctomycetes bacterium]|nr:type II methionyl aminopeptidase [Planctomycetota bacterium]